MSKEGDNRLWNWKSDMSVVSRTHERGQPEHSRNPKKIQM